MTLSRIMNDALGYFIFCHFGLQLPLTYKKDGLLMAPAELRNAASRAKLNNQKGGKGNTHIH